MKTVVIQIGNTDNKLSQQTWARFCVDVGSIVKAYANEIHFAGGPSTDSSYQNMAFIFTCDENHLIGLRSVLRNCRAAYSQDSIAYMEGNINLV